MRKDKAGSFAFRVSFFQLATTLSTGAWALLAVVAIVSGCATTGDIPSSLLTCRDRPVAGPMPLQSDVSRYIVENDLAGEDCRRKLGAVRGIVLGGGPNLNVPSSMGLSVPRIPSPAGDVAGSKVD